MKSTTGMPLCSLLNKDKVNLAIYLQATFPDLEIVQKLTDGGVII